MDLLSLFTSSQGEATFEPETEAEAFITILQAIAKADGGMTSEKTHAFVNAATSKKMFAYYDTGVLFEIGATNYLKYGNSVIPPSVAKISEQNKKMVFVFCVDIALADGVIASGEVEALTQLGNLLGIDAIFAKSVIEVMEAKNKGNTIQ